MYMSAFSQRTFGSLKQKILSGIPESSKFDALRSGLAITFSVAMATFFVCDVCAIEETDEKKYL